MYKKYTFDFNVEGEIVGSVSRIHLQIIKDRTIAKAGVYVLLSFLNNREVTLDVCILHFLSRFHAKGVKYIVFGASMARLGESQIHDAIVSFVLLWSAFPSEEEK